MWSKNEKLLIVEEKLYGGKKIKLFIIFAIFWRFTHTTKGCVDYWRKQKVAKNKVFSLIHIPKLSLISLVRTSKCLRLEVLKPFYDCVNINCVKITAYCAAKFRRCFFFQISNGWYLSNFNVWHFSYFDCSIFSQCNFTFIKTSPPITWSEVAKNISQITIPAWIDISGKLGRLAYNRSRVVLILWIYLQLFV